MNDPRPDLLIWGGPVSTANLGPLANPAAWPRPTQIVTISQGIGGIGSTAFRSLASQYSGAAGGSVLDGLLASKRAKASDYRRIYIAGFSAFHGLAAPMLAADGDRITAAVLLDACFTAIPASPIPGFVSYGRKAIANERVMVITSSWGGGPGSGGGVRPDYSRGSDAAEQTYFAAGGKLDRYENTAIPKPADALRTGCLVWLDYEARYTHEQHVTKLGPTVLQAFLFPLSSNEAPSTPGVTAPKTYDDSSDPMTIAAGAILFGVASVMLTRKSRS